MNILLIEDSPIVAAALVRNLTRKGHSVTHGEGIGAAFDFIYDVETGKKGPRPDVVVTDRDVVGGDAWEFVGEAVKLGHLPDRVVYMTGRPTANPPGVFFFKGGDDPRKLFTLIEGLVPAAGL